MIRYYDSGNANESSLGYGFGFEFPLWASSIVDFHNSHYAMINERENFFLPFRNRKNEPGYVCWIDPRILNRGYTNYNRSAIKGRPNFINRKASFKMTSKYPHGIWSLELGDGTKRIYSEYVEIPEHQQKRIHSPTKTAYLLTKEIKPNGNQIHFSYAPVRGNVRLTHIKTLDRNECAILSELKFQYSSNKRQLSKPKNANHHLYSLYNNCIITNSSGDQVEYLQEERHRMKGHWSNLSSFLQKASSSQKGDSQFAMNSKWKLKEIKKPRNRFQRVSYHPSGKVKSLYEPLDTLEPIKTY